LEMIKGLEKGKITLITPDGPRGPRHKIKPGVIFSAQKVQASIIAYHWTGSRYWTLGSWDRLRIPKPFSKVYVTCEQALACTLEDDPGQLEAMLTARLHPNRGHSVTLNNKPHLD